MPALAGRTPPQKLNTTCFSTKSLSVVGPMLPAETPPRVAGWSDILIYGSLKPHERNPGKMTFTTASGLLPAGIAVYVQRGPNGVGLETRYLVGLATSMACCLTRWAC